MTQMIQMKQVSTKGLINKLRKLGGKWKAHNHNFGTYYYVGEWKDSHWEICSYAYLDDYEFDDSFTVRWQIYRDNVPFGWLSSDPSQQLSMID